MTLKDQILAQFKSRSSERTLRQLHEALYPEPVPETQAEIDRLVREGTLKVAFRVHSSATGDGLEDFETREEIPGQMEDESQDPPQEFKVGPGNISVVYSRSR